MKKILFTDGKHPLVGELEKFREAGEYHGALEEIYRDAMDFSRMNRESAGIRKQILQALTEG